MKKLAWVRKQLEIASEGRSDFLGNLREPFLRKIEAAGEDLTRFQLWRLFQDLRPEADALYDDWKALDIQLCYEADLSEIWDTTNAPLLPEIETAAKFDATELPHEFVKIGGQPDWIQDEDYPICEECDCNMALLMQLRSLPYELTNEHKQLRAFIFPGGGNIYLFKCPKCSSLRGTLQC